MHAPPRCLVLPVDKVSGSIHGVDDPRGLLREDAGFAICHCLLTDEAAAKRRDSLGPGIRGRGQGQGSVSPVRPLSELRLQGIDDGLLHSLVCLGDQVHGRALGLDLDLALSGVPDLLNPSR